MDKKWVLSKLFLSIGVMQNARQSSEKSSARCLLAVEKSANSEYNILQSMNFLRIYKRPGITHGSARFPARVL